MRTTTGKYLLKFLAATVLILGLASAGWADTPSPIALGTPDSTQGDQFVVTIKKLEVSTDGGSNWTTVWDTDKQLDIASVAVGQKAGNFAEDISVTAGNYNRYRATISSTFTIKGVVYLPSATNGLDAGWYYTRSRAPGSAIQPRISAYSGYAATEAAARAAGDFGSTTVTPSGSDLVMTGALDVSISIGGSAYFQINFNLTNKFGLYALAPTNGVTYYPYIYPEELAESDIVITY